MEHSLDRKNIDGQSADPQGHAEEQVLAAANIEERSRQGDFQNCAARRGDEPLRTKQAQAGLFDNAGAMKIVANIWTRSARDWSHIDAASTQHPGQPDAPAPRP